MPVPTTATTAWGCGRLGYGCRAVRGRAAAERLRSVRWACPSVRAKMVPNPRQCSPVLLFALALGSYGRWRGPSQALAVMAAVVDWGSWPRNGLPECPANLETMCRLGNTAVDSASVASPKGAHLFCMRGDGRKGMCIWSVSSTSSEKHGS
jgi:hypothetical protein